MQAENSMVHQKKSTCDRGFKFDHGGASRRNQRRLQTPCWRREQVALAVHLVEDLSNYVERRNQIGPSVAYVDSHRFILCGNWRLILQQRPDCIVEYHILWIGFVRSDHIKILVPRLVVSRIDFALDHVQFFSNLRKSLFRLNQHKTIHSIGNVHRYVRRCTVEHVETRSCRTCFENRLLTRCHAQGTCASARAHHKMKIYVVSPHAVERVAQVHFNKVTHANTKQWTRNVTFKSPRVVVDYARSNFALSFTNGPVDYFSTLLSAADRNRNVRSEGPARILARKVRLWRKHKWRRDLFFMFSALNCPSKKEPHTDSQSARSPYDQPAVRFVAHSRTSNAHERRTMMGLSQ